MQFLFGAVAKAAATATILAIASALSTCRFLNSHDTRRIDDLRPRRNREILADPRYRLIFDVNLGFVTSVRSYDFAITNQETHTKLC